MRKIFILLLLCLSLGFSATPNNTIIVIIDGTRYQEAFETMWDKDKANDTMPEMWNLRKQATLMTKLYIGNPSKLTETNPGHATLLTGTYQNVFNDMSQYIKVQQGEDLQMVKAEGKVTPDMPTLFEYYHKAYPAATKNATYLIVGKEKLKVMAYSTHPEYGETYGAAAWNIKQYYASFPDNMYYVNNLLDNVVWLRTQEIITKDHPQLMLINLPLVDYIGHKEFAGDDQPTDDVANSDPSLNAYTLYTNAIRNADHIVGELWRMIEADPLYAGKTNLIVLTDHGRHSNHCNDGIKNHDGKQCTKHNDPLDIGTCESTQHLFFFAIGPNFKENYWPKKTYRMIDIAPTIGKAMNFPTPYAEGTVIEEILK